MDKDTAKILVLEDEIIMIFELKESFEDVGYQSSFEIDGFETAGNTKDNYSNPIIFNIPGYSNDETTDKMKKFDPVTILHKPLIIKDLQKELFKITDYF